MLAQVKAKRKDFTMPFDEDKPAAAEASHQSDIRSSGDQEDDKEATKMTCDVLCSLSTATSPIPGGSAKSGSPVSHDSCLAEGLKRKSSKTCPKQLQLPMFLSSKSLIVVGKTSSRIPCCARLCPCLGRNKELY